MRLLVKNLRGHPYALDLGPFPNIPGLGTSIRQTLAPTGLPGDTLDIGSKVSLYDVNLSSMMRQLITPVGSTTITTTVSGGYTVTASPPGALSLTILADGNDVTSAVLPPSGGGGGGGGGGWAITTVVWVDAINGADASADGTPAKPWQTISGALGSITDASAAKPYTLVLAPGSYDSNFSLRAFISFAGLSREDVQLTGTMDLASTTWAISGATSELSHVTFTNAELLDWGAAATPAADARLSFTDCRFLDVCQLTSPQPTSTGTFTACALARSFTQSGGAVFFYQTSVEAGGESTTISTSGGTFNAFGGGARGLNEGADFSLGGVVNLSGFGLANGQVVASGVFSTTVEGVTPNADLSGVTGLNLYTSALGLRYQDTNSAFVSPSPVDVQTTLDRLASAVRGLLGSQIP